MKRSAIAPLQTTDNALATFAQAVKHNVDMMTGQHANAPVLKELAATASTAEIVAMLNIVIRRLQGDSQ